ncbi:hypothetical protein BC826DRAFT_974689 [Russula brevipes]|nr:hypothetical protein BC826DRAFT_974689 [Russula brevipes]
MDYALSQTMTIGGTEQIPRLLLLYDIMCQWGIHAKQRFALNGLSMSKVNEILWGVGIWHHIGLVDGEILETLWSLLNQVSESCQTMSLASREETINFHMNDINRKKNMEMKTLIRKWLKAQKLVQQRGRILEGLNESCTHDDRKQWQTEMDEILEKRITDPGIMDDFLSSVETEPQRADIELMMQKEEAACNEVPGRTKWVIEGIKLQEEQLRLQAHLVHSSLTQAEQRVTLNWQNQLGTKIVKHNDQGTQWLKEDAGDITSIRLHHLLDEDEWSGDSLVISGNTSQTCAVTSPEQRPIDLPSSRGLEFCRNNQEVATIEGDLRIAQADEHLHLIRQNLIHRANLYRTTIRHTSTVPHLPAMWKPLGVSQQQCKTYQDLTKEDLYTNTKTYDATSPESYRQKLPWFWLIKVKTRVDDDKYIASFFRLRWIHATLSLSCSKEEVAIVEAEMEMVHASYHSYATEWTDRAMRMANHPGAKAFALNQNSIWQAPGTRGVGGMKDNRDSKNPGIRGILALSDSRDSEIPGGSMARDTDLQSLQSPRNN